MATPVKPIPDGYHVVTPYLIVKGAQDALAFYKKIFAATASICAQTPDGKIMHAEMKIGDSIVMLADEFPQMNALSPQSIGGSPISLHLYVENVDRLFAQAIAAGAKMVRPVQDQFYGDRSGSFIDPFGHTWHIATHIEDVTPEEIDRRFAATMKQPV